MRSWGFQKVKSCSFENLKNAVFQDGVLGVHSQVYLLEYFFPTSPQWSVSDLCESHRSLWENWRRCVQGITLFQQVDRPNKISTYMNLTTWGGGGHSCVHWGILWTRKIIVLSNRRKIFCKNRVLRHKGDTKASKEYYVNMPMSGNNNSTFTVQIHALSFVHILNMGIYD
jgi:hypothetical protein